MSYGYIGDTTWDTDSLLGKGAFPHTAKAGSLVPHYSAALTDAGAAKRGVKVGEEFVDKGRTLRYDDRQPGSGDYVDVYEPDHAPDPGVSEASIAKQTAIAARRPGVGTLPAVWSPPETAATKVGSEPAFNGSTLVGNAPSTEQTATPTVASTPSFTGSTLVGTAPSTEAAPAQTGVAQPAQPTTVAATPPAVAPVAPVSQEDIAQHEADAANDPNVLAKKKAETQRQALLDEANNRILTQHSTSLDPNDPRVTLRINPDTGSQRITGRDFVPGDPVHERLLQGVPDTDRQKLPVLSQAIARGDPFSFLHYSAPEEGTYAAGGGSGALGPGAGARPTAETRAYEQAISTAGQRAAGAAGQLQRVTMIPQRLVVAQPQIDKANRVMLEGFANDSVMNNTEHVLNGAQAAGIPVPYQNSGFQYQRDLAGYIQNQQHGYRGDGQGPVLDAEGKANQTWLNEQQKPPDQRYIPHLLNRDQAEFHNAVMNILPSVPKEPTTQFQQKAQKMAAAHASFIGQHEGENKLRAQLDAKLPPVGMRNKKGEVTRHVPWSKGTLEPTYRAYRLENIRDLAPPILSQSIRATTAGPHAISVAPIAMHTAAEFRGRPGGGAENPEIGSPETGVPTSKPDPGLLSRVSQPPPAPIWTAETAASFNPRVQGASYPGNQPQPPVELPPPAPEPAAAPAEPEQEPGGQEFASPNYREGLNFNGAKRALKSKWHAAAREFHGRVDQAMAEAAGAPAPETKDAIGDWADGAENSTTTAHQGVPWQMRREGAALKGLHSAQKQTIAFDYRPEGEHSLYTLRFPTDNPNKVRDALTQAGLQFRTIEAPEKGQPTTVHVVDMDGGAQEGIEKLINEGHLEQKDIKRRKGFAEFLGDPEGASREVGAREFRRVLQEARDRNRGGEGGQGPTLPWFDALQKEAEQSYRDVSQTKEIRSPLEAEDLRLAAIDRANLTPEERERLENVRATARKWVEEHPESNPLSAHHFIEGQEQFPEGVRTKEDIGKFFNARNKRLDYSKPADRQVAVDTLTHDVMHAIAAGSDAPDWYDRTVDRSLHQVGTVAPEILTNPDDEMAFKLATAVTSQGQDVFPNFESGYLAYRHWKHTGEFPTDPEIFGGGTKAPAMIENFEKLNRLWKKHGTDGLRKILETPMTMRELRDTYGADVAGESLDHTMEGAAMLGPKIGSFYNNLNKRFHSTTFDLWASRNLNRIAGNMFDFSDSSLRKDTAERDSHLTQMRALLDSGAIEAPAAQLSKMRAEVEKLAKVPEGKMTRERAMRTAPTILDWAKTAHKTYAKGSGGRSYPTELKTPGNLLAKNFHLNLTDLADAPRNATERQQWRQIYNETLEQLKDHGVDLTHADQQATLWYPEQRLFQLAGSRNRGSFDYLDAAHRLTRKIRSGQLPPLHEPLQTGA